MDSISGLFSGEVNKPVTEEEISAGRAWLKIDAANWEGPFNTYLLTRTYVEGSFAVSRADAVLYEIVFSVVVEWKAKQIKASQNIVRWFDLIQHAKISQRDHIQPFARPAPAFLTAASSPAAAAPAGDQAKPQAGKPQAGKPQGKPQEKKPQEEQKQESKPQEKQQAAKKEPAAKQPKQKGKGKGAPPPKEPEGTDFSRLNIVVGQIKSASKHPDADSLYHEQIDLGEDKPREVVSGLVKHIGLDEFIGKKVLVLTNLKPAKMRGILSSGMVLCASSEESLEVLSPPEGAKIGERLSVEGEDGAADEQLNPKKKVWDRVRDSGDFTVSAEGEITYKGNKLLSSAGSVLSSKKLVGAKIA